MPSKMEAALFPIRNIITLHIRAYRRDLERHRAPAPCELTGFAQSRLTLHRERIRQTDLLYFCSTVFLYLQAYIVKGIFHDQQP